MNSAWLFAGGAAMTGLLATCWSYFRSFYSYVMSWMIITVTVQGYQSDALMLYLQQNFKPSKFGPRLYSAWMLNVRPKRRTQLVSMEIIGSGGRLFWNGWRPLWASKSSGGDDSVNEGGLTSRDYNLNAMSFTFPRGVFRCDDLILEATEYFNEHMLSLDRSDDDSKRRHYVKHIFGTAGKPMGSISLVLTEVRLRHRRTHELVCIIVR